MKEQNERKFKGIWIPAEIWESDGLTLMEKCLIAEVDSLSTKREWCTASNGYLAKLFGCTPGHIANMVSSLSGRYLKVVIENGNKRRMMCIEYTNPSSVDEPPLHPLMNPPSSVDEPNRDISREISNSKNSPATAEHPTPPQAIATQERERCTDVPPPPGFDEIWNLYGHKQQKSDAIKAYKAMKSQADKDALTEAIPAYLAFLSLPGNSWRQKKLLGAFIRGRMWEDDFAAKKVEHPVNMSDGNGSLYDFVSKEFPNVQKMKWLTNEQFEIFDTRGAEMFGGNYTIYASPIALKKHIRDSFSELNSNSFKRSQYQDVYSYLCEDIKKRIYPK